ncbi:tetratricopeptide repeat protein [Roseovarius salinarum]|uniref:tetratricopeptide repeat protein n=1 Tax=Roseovarius salinarum TaxID=1981892 RepID=UPI000C32F120|nr:tetratricopeptide repeat protein [Roseovarius salinarum]
MTIRALLPLSLAALLQALALPVFADPAVGPYLAARQARYANDFQAAAQYYTRALASDPGNPALLESTIIAQMSLGEMEKARAVAAKMEADDLKSQVAHMALIAGEVEAGEYGALLGRIDAGRGIGPLGDGLIAGWAHLGQGDMSKALDAFDEVSRERGLNAFALYHKALALASVGDFEGADKIYSNAGDTQIQRTRRGTLAWIEVLSQLDRNEDALALISDVFGADPGPRVTRMRARLEDGERLSFTRIRGAREGIAEVFYSLGQALRSDAGEDYALLYARVAEYLDPGHVDAVLLSAELLEALERYELATESYARVPRDHPAFHVAEMGRAEALRSAGKDDAAIEVLAQLTETHPRMASVHVTLGDHLRQQQQFERAARAYDAALEIYENRDTDQWFVHYARGICHERLDNWEKAEADFRRALELNPDQPQVLNYLGYSLVEKRETLDEALSMIERAVEAEPDSGYIVDSLGWALYRLGRYDEAVEHMERAVELMPMDPVVNDHLGDVLWAVGRKTEARFQWRRALSFVDKENPSPDVELERIRRKLEVGLDRVLAEEGSPPLTVAGENGG